MTPPGELISGPEYTPLQSKIVQAFRNPRYIEQWYEVQLAGHLWDSISLEPGQQFSESVELFNTPVSQRCPHSGRFKTHADTSMQVSRRLFAPEAFAVRRVLFTFSRDADERDLYAIAEGFVWRMNVGAKWYFGCPIISLQQAELGKSPIRICDYCRSVYVDARCPGCGATEFSLSHLGGATAGRCFLLDVGPGGELLLENEAAFWIGFVGDTYTLINPLKLWVHFEGPHARPIR